MESLLEFHQYPQEYEFNKERPKMSGTVGWVSGRLDGGPSEKFLLKILFAFGRVQSGWKSPLLDNLIANPRQPPTKNTFSFKKTRAKARQNDLLQRHHCVSHFWF